MKKKRFTTEQIIGGLQRFLSFAVATISRSWGVVSLFFCPSHSGEGCQAEYEKSSCEGQNGSVVALTDCGSCYEGDEGGEGAYNTGSYTGDCSEGLHCEGVEVAEEYSRAIRIIDFFDMPRRAASIFSAISV